MKRNMHYVVWIFCLAICASSCVRQFNEVDDDSTSVRTQTANDWILSVMSQQYLYNDYIKQVSLDYKLSAEDFFTSLLSRRSSDNDGKHTAGRDYFYSYLEHLTTSRAEVGRSVTYGLEARFYYTDNTCQYICGRVAYVLPGSAAAQAGLKRCDWITKINGEPITTSDIIKLEQGGAVTFTVERYVETVSNGCSVYKRSDVRQVQLKEASLMDVSPVLLDTVYQIGHQKVAYLVYNQFTTGPLGYVDTRYDEQLRDVFMRFKNEGVHELVLDLRYNPGGYLLCCQKLCSMIVPQENLGELFCIQTYNSALDTVRKSYLLDLSEVGDCNLNLHRLYVLTTSWTASSSELLINCLRPYMDVRVVGTTTEGKDVGSIEFQSGLYGISLHPVVSKAWNSKFESDYAMGFKPDLPVDDELNYTDIKELGDPNELLLHAALSDMSGTKMSASSWPTAASPWMKPCTTTHPLLAPLRMLILDVRNQ